ncbi:SacI homology domain-containing protein [Ochromonadaceae sp. CCMP2298]|nr:SacI homology domain-containing protein [Ochromonadaceae sp. CCMP2298]|mmetsp:Transcript_34037/g.75005  ORF Transcript_34037/g.75005 Transcript_34037/m.75005 type:complete len:1692 (-) Transcript_34037:127-5202(-)|eukprot:CAMPEP_0173197648 /NCGR_PEP_ID=MMETSP1141-20130122/16276_1 /TAXON_ID=483371 /ORGANISM="non described non described, Strain CCMP2298" /LENGTH=1691 /DNA_ID=CAMNT_0014122409 /DNA_START=66 /DNA_END=5141 /DNA_ORIENTATION=-
MPKEKHPLESCFSRLEKFRLYATSPFYYLVGFNQQETQFRVLKINRQIAKPKELEEIVREDHLVYNSSEIAEVLQMIDEGNKSTGGLVKMCTAFGLVGFVKFLDCFYFTLITQRKEVGCIAGNYIYSIRATEMFPIRAPDEPDSSTFRSIWKKLNKKLSQSSAEVAESRYMGLFQFVDLTKDFFFSYTYDLTHSLQHNHVHSAAVRAGLLQTASTGETSNLVPPLEPQDMFEWNNFQVEALSAITGPIGSSHWVLPLVHGSYQQKRFSLFGKSVDLVLIARRSRHYAGTRYLKRGVNVHGKTANDVEIEQIIQMDDRGRTNFCSYLQMRGSIPTYWYQETSVTMPKPPILINRVDPDYRETEEHIADLFRRYSAPIIALDLVKQHERRARESIVGREFRQAVAVVNESIVPEHQVRYIALDYSRITSIAKGKARGGKGAQNPSQSAGKAVGDEWALLVESSLVNKAQAKEDAPARATSPAEVGNAARRGAVSGASAGAAGVGAGSRAAANNVDKDDEEKPSAYQLLAQQQQQQMGPSTAEGRTGDWQRVLEEARIDVLRELEDIATMTLSETSFFCNTQIYLDRVSLLSEEKRKALVPTGFLQQRGVLRTNCIDCLDRTNGAQFAVAMKFLTISLRALGVCSAQQAPEPTSQMLISLMEMYGEMGDKIALQYGGSEAHRKVPGGQATSSSKQSELLTSIKRYYSNAFTDMIKQDAMNVFLGCFKPTESSTHLWDLDSDFNLHNQSLRPPSPRVNRVLYADILLDSHATSVPTVRQLIESSVKKALTDETKERVCLIPVHSRKKLRKVLQSEELTVETEQLEDVIEYLKAFKMPDVELPIMLKQYFMRHMTLKPVPPRVPGDSGDFSPDKDADETPSRETPSPILHHMLPEFASKLHLKLAARSIARLEKRKFLRRVSSKKIAVAAGAWWREALEEYESNLFGASRKLVKEATQSAERRKREGRVDRDYPAKGAEPKHVAGFFQRVYEPSSLSEFDAILALDFGAPVDAVNDITEIPPRVMQNRPVARGRVGSPGARTGGSGDVIAESTAAHLSADGTWVDAGADGPGHPSSIMYHSLPGRFEKETSASVSAAADRVMSPAALAVALRAAGQSQGSSFMLQRQFHEHPAEVVAAPALLADLQMGVLPPSLQGDLGTASSGALSPGRLPASPGSGGPEAVGEEEGGAGGFQISRFVRRMVGGFLRKDEAAPQPVSVFKATAARGPTKQEWSWQQHMISHHEHLVSRQTSQLYTRYALCAQNSLVLMEKPGSQRAAEEEYFLLLRDHNISVDNVTGMEHLAIEGYVSSEINQGEYQGLLQYDSAMVAQCFLMTCMAQLEPELQATLPRPVPEPEPAVGLTVPDFASLAGAAASASGAGAGADTGAGTGVGAGTGAAKLSRVPGLGALPKDERAIVSRALEKAPELRAHISRCTARAKGVSGLDRGLRDAVGRYIKQQTVYARDISVEHLSMRASPSTSEKTIIEYGTQFHPACLALDLDGIAYTMSDTVAKEAQEAEEVAGGARPVSAGSAAVYGRYVELGSLQAVLAPVQTSLKEQKKLQLQKPAEREKSAQNSPQGTSLGHDLKQSHEPSISEQLGLGGHIACLTKDLQQYTQPTHHVNQNTLGVSTDLGADLSLYSMPFPYVGGAFEMDPCFGESVGFLQVDPDVYVRSTNPFMQVNEVTVGSFAKMLSTH